MSERDRVYLRDMLDAAREALSFAEGQDRNRLESDRKLALALVMEVAIIGEAAGRVSREVIESAPGIPWPKMVSMRNRLIHLLVPTKLDYLSTLGIEQLFKHVGELVTTYNRYAQDSGNREWTNIGPQILGVLFTMISVRNGLPISAQQQYIEQVLRLKVPVFETLIRENKTIYADAPEYGVPVVLQRVSGRTYEDVQDELEGLTTEVLAKAAAV